MIIYHKKLINNKNKHGRRAIRNLSYREGHTFASELAITSADFVLVASKRVDDYL